jgi:fused signal recognition particle receptor
MFNLFKKSPPKPAPEAEGPTATPAATSATQPAAPAPVAPMGNAEEGRTRAFFNRLRDGLKNTGSKLTTLFTGRRIDEALFEELEDALISADAGVDTAAVLITGLRARARRDKLETAEQLRQALADLLADMLRPLEQPEVPDPKRGALPKPFVIMLAGVNGAGKTTSIGKLAKRFQARGLSVMLAAGDTFRAAAREQLAAWGEQNGVAVIAQSGGDPAAVIFDAVQAARARGIDVLLADTAGRLPTQLHLMEEVKKIKRVIAKADAAAPHAVWLVLDANTGQNAVSQLKAFDAAVGVTGIILTKLDGTAKGGVVAAIAHGRSNEALGRAQANGTASKGIPPLALSYIGVGEGIDDLRPFQAEQFVSALLGGTEYGPAPG